MTFNPNADVSDNRARRSTGRTVGVAAGGIGGVGIVIAIVVALLGGNPMDVLGAGQQQQPAIEASPVADCKTGADANADPACRLAASTLSLDKFWAGKVEGYTPPEAIIYSGTEQSPCGTASNQVGPFYCPSDQGIYVDPSFFSIMQQQFGASAGSLAQLYVLGHEWGHHIQSITGIMQQHPNNGTGEDSNGVKTELQADCFAGAWIKDLPKEKDSKGVSYFKAPTDAEIDDALNAAAAVGDDNIQSRSGRVNPETWTHGSSAERKKWFMTGYQQGINACNTF